MISIIPFGMIIFLIVVFGLVALADEWRFSAWCFGIAGAIFCILCIAGLSSKTVVTSDELLPITVETSASGVKQSVVEYIDMSEKQTDKITTRTKHNFGGIIENKEVRVVQSYNENWLYYTPTSATFTPKPLPVAPE